METLKVIYEIKYPRILSFREFYKPIINPYFLYPSAKYAIGNEGTHQEYIRLTFEESKYYLVFTPDTISFQYEGSIQDLLKDGSHITTVFEVFRKLKESTHLLKISSELLEMFSFKDYSEDFVNTFVQKSKIDLFIDEPEDYAIIEEGSIDNYKCFLQYGPFKSSKDVKSYNLFSLDSLKKLEYSQKNGLLINSKLYSTDLDSVNKKTFIDITNKNLELINKVIAKYD